MNSLLINENKFLPVINTQFSFFGGHSETVEPGWYWPPEHHPAFELMYIISGRQRTVTETADLLLNPGDITIIPIEYNHTSYCVGTSPMLYFSMHFNLDDPTVRFLLIQYFTNRIITPDNSIYQDLKKRVENTMRIAKDDYTVKDKLDIQINVINIFNILAEVAHSSLQNIPKQGTINRFLLFHQIANKIKDDLDYQTFHAEAPKVISISNIIQSFHISQSTALNLFKEYANTTPQKFLLNLKLTTAKNLLLQPNLSIQDISYKLGYSAPSHFSREFKRTFNVTPRQYIQQYKQQHHIN